MDETEPEPYVEDLKPHKVISDLALFQENSGSDEMLKEQYISILELSSTDDLTLASERPRVTLPESTYKSTFLKEVSTITKTHHSIHNDRTTTPVKFNIDLSYDPIIRKDSLELSETKSAIRLEDINLRRDGKIRAKNSINETIENLEVTEVGEAPAKETTENKSIQTRNTPRDDENVVEKDITVEPTNILKSPLLQTAKLILLFLLYLAHVIAIAIATSFLGFYLHSSSFMKSLNYVLSGLFLGVASIALNYEMIRIRWAKQDRWQIIKKMIISYVIIIGASIALVFILDYWIFEDRTQTAYWILGAEAITLMATFVIYTIYVALVKIILREKFKKSPEADKNKKNDSGMKKFGTIGRRGMSVRRAAFAQLMIIYPFLQLFVSVTFVNIFHELSDKKVNIWWLFLLCTGYPLAIDISKGFMKLASRHGTPKMKFYVEYLSLAFAALPFRMIYFDIEHYDLLLVVLLAKFLYKSFVYLVIGSNVEKLHTFIDRIGQKFGKKSKETTLPISTVQNKAGTPKKNDEDLDFQLDKQVNPLCVDVAMKYLLLTFNDLFSTITMMIIVATFSRVKNGFLGTVEDANNYVKFSSIDLGCDILFMFVALLVWKLVKSDIRNVDFYVLGKKFFSRYYMVFLAANFNLFYTLSLVVDTLIGNNTE